MPNIRISLYFIFPQFLLISAVFKKLVRNLCIARWLLIKVTPNGIKFHFSLFTRENSLLRSLNLENFVVICIQHFSSDTGCICVLHSQIGMCSLTALESCKFFHCFLFPFFPLSLSNNVLMPSYTRNVITEVNTNVKISSIFFAPMY